MSGCTQLFRGCFAELWRFAPCCRSIRAHSLCHQRKTLNLLCRALLRLFSVWSCHLDSENILFHLEGIVRICRWGSNEENGCLTAEGCVPVPFGGLCTSARLRTFINGTQTRTGTACLQFHQTCSHVPCFLQQTHNASVYSGFPLQLPRRDGDLGFGHLF